MPGSPNRRAISSRTFLVESLPSVLHSDCYPGIGLSHFAALALICATLGFLSPGRAAKLLPSRFSISNQLTDCHQPALNSLREVK